MTAFLSFIVTPTTGDDEFSFVPHTTSISYLASCALQMLAGRLSLSASRSVLLAPALFLHRKQTVIPER